jgi:DNA-binding NarL/FixJ family response regulator
MQKPIFSISFQTLSTSLSLLMQDSFGWCGDGKGRSPGVRSSRERRRQTTRRAQPASNSLARVSRSGAGRLEPPTASPRASARSSQLLAEGDSSKAIARSLDLSVKTVETHRDAIMRKLDLHSLADPVRYAIRNRIIVP